MGNKTLLKTRFAYLPIIKFLVSKFPLGDIKFVIKSHLELPEKSIKYPSPVLLYLIPMGCDFGCLIPMVFPPPLSGGWGIDRYTSIGDS